jgi:hypothetical protein
MEWHKQLYRGKTHVEAACLSLLGSTRPGRFADYMKRAIVGGVGDDGLIQRFGLLVWPDQNGDWKEVDRYPNSDARRAAWDTFYRLSDLDPDAIVAEHDEYDNVPFPRFDDEAHAIFAEWRGRLEGRLRSNELSPALESHSLLSL